MTTTALRPGQDPRDAFPNHHERGPKRWMYTYADIARAAGLSVGTVKNYKKLGRFDPADLASVARLICREDRRERKSSEVGTKVGGGDQAATGGAGESEGAKRS